MKIIYTLMLAVLLTAVNSGCAYYRYTSDVTKYEFRATTQSEWQNLDEQYILVFHYHDRMMEVADFSFNQAMDSITLSSQPFDDKELYYYNRVIEDRNWKSTRPLGSVYKEATRQVHLFLNKSDSIADGSFKFAVSDIGHIDVVNKAANVPLLIAGGAVVVFVVAPIVFLAIACGCPHVYVDHGNGLELSNSLFTGAKSIQLERYDYKLIPDYQSDSTKLSITIANDLNENQYTNLLELIAVLHPAQLTVIPDQTGHLHTIENPQSPKTAIDNSGQNVLNEVKTQDDFAYSFNPDSLNELSELYMTFPGPGEQINGKLVLSVRNSPWAGYAFNEFASMFGKNYTDWVERNKNKTREEREQWMREQGIQLLVDVKTEQGWKNVDQVEIVGEISYNSVVVPLLFPPNSDTVEIRLRSAFMFWELDYAAIDYSADQQVETQVLRPSIAYGSNQEDFVEALSFDDDKYMESIATKASATILFDSLHTSPELKRTLILCGKGYYTSNELYMGKTNRKELRKFRNPGELSRFSQRLYIEAKAHTAQN